MNEEESVDDPLSIHEEKIKDENIVIEVKEEVIDDDPLNIQEIYKLGDGENKTFVDDIDIVQHKIETDNY